MKRTWLWRALAAVGAVFTTGTVFVGLIVLTLLNPNLSGMSQSAPATMRLSPDGAWVVYRLDKASNNLLYSAPVDGSSAPVELATVGGLFGKLTDFRISPDSSHVVYRTDGSWGTRLYQVPLEGGTAQELAVLPAGAAYIEDFVISPASTHLVYRVSARLSSKNELYSLTLATGERAPLNAPLSDDGTVLKQYQVTPDNSRVVYTTYEESQQMRRLYSVPLAGGTPTKLSDHVSWQFVVSPDSSRVVYHGNQEIGGAGALVSVAVGGGDPIVLSRTLTEGELFWGFAASADSRHVVYQIADNVGGERQLYQVPVEGGEFVQLNAPDSNAIWFAISPDSRSVSYVATNTQQDNSKLFELHTRSLRDPAVAAAQPTQLPAQSAWGFALSPDGRYVVYQASQSAQAGGELYSVPVSGGAPVRLYGPVLPQSGVSGFAISPDSNFVVYSAKSALEVPFALYSVPITGGTLLSLHAPLASDDMVFYDFVISPDSNRVVYRLGQMMFTTHNYEIYSVPVAGGENTMLNDEGEA